MTSAHRTYGCVQFVSTSCFFLSPLLGSECWGIVCFVRFLQRNGMQSLFVFDRVKGILNLEKAVMQNEHSKTTQNRYTQFDAPAHLGRASFGRRTNLKFVMKNTQSHRKPFCWKTSASACGCCEGAHCVAAHFDCIVLWSLIITFCADEPIQECFVYYFSSVASRRMPMDVDHYHAIVFVMHIFYLRPPIIFISRTPHNQHMHWWIM